MSIALRRQMMSYRTCFSSFQNVRVVHTLRSLSAPEAEVKAAKAQLNSLNEEAWNENKHDVYPLLKQMYREVPAALRQADEDQNVSLAVITGSGDFYCSGNDIRNFADVSPDKIKEVAEESGVVLRNFVQGFIDFTKPLIAAVNGPVIGVACTTLGLFDVVYASDAAHFHTPFPALGQSPEGCSSYKFPKIMGEAKANEILLFGRKFTAQEAKERCLVTDVFSQSTFHAEVNKRIKEYSNLPRLASVASKSLIKQSEKELLTKINKIECDLLVKLWQTPDFYDAINRFLSRKKRL